MSTEVKDRISIALRFHQAGRLDDAQALYTEILSEYPDNADTLNLLGLLNIQNNKFEEAILYLKKAVEINPCAYFYGGLGRAYLENDNFEEAIDCYKKSLNLKPEDFDSWFNLGLTYKKSGEIANSIKAYQKALSIKPNHPSVHFNLGNLYESINDTVSSLENYKKAYDYSEDKDNDVHYFLGLAYLKVKDFKNGLFHHESRPSKPFSVLCQTQQFKELMESTSMWTGEDIKDKTLFVYYESALGDTLMYVRYLELLKDKCAKVLFKPQICFTEFFKENNFGAEIIESKTLPKDVVFDTHIPLMSIPYVLNLNTEEIPLSEGYLKANAQKAKEYKEKYFNNDKFKIGIKWMGNTAYDLDRIINIESFYKLLDLPNTQFYSVQKGEGVEELAKIPSKYNIVDLGDTFNDFGDTAAALENMDLIICNDTSVAHLAGAMGKPCWVMLPFVQNWRWHTDISYSPWYKSIKLFKQNQPGNWSEVFDRACIDLKNLINGKVSI